jgi:uncharacterized coiled-coil protein SlyX
MTSQDLARIVDSLHQSLTATQSLDDATRAKLRGVIVEIQDVLDKNMVDPLPEKDPDDVSRLSDRLHALVADFEQQHPQLTNNLALIAERLSDMGI